MKRKGGNSMLRQISVFLENKPGKLYEFVKVLKKNDINMRALCLAEVAEYGVLRVIVDDPYELSQVLKEEDYIFRMTPVLGVTIEDKPGALVDILDALAKAGINLEYTYAFTASVPGEAYIILRVNDVEGGAKALSKAGIRLLEEEDVARL
jgi:hypothetical protein